MAERPRWNPQADGKARSAETAARMLAAQIGAAATAPGATEIAKIAGEAAPVIVEIAEMSATQLSAAEVDRRFALLHEVGDTLEMDVRSEPPARQAAAALEAVETFDRFSVKLFETWAADIDRAAWQNAAAELRALAGRAGIALSA